MIERTIMISGKEVTFRSSATVPRLYRAKYKRDIFKDLSKLEKSYTLRTKDGDELQIEDLEIFENVAYIMAFHADPTIPATITPCLYMHDTAYWTDMVSECKGAEVLSVSEMASNEEVWADWLKQENEYAVGDRKSMEAGAGKYLNFIKIVLRKKA